MWSTASEPGLSGFIDVWDNKFPWSSLSCVKRPWRMYFGIVSDLIQLRAHDLKSGFIIWNHEHMIWNHYLLYEIMNTWFEIRICCMKSWTHGLKSGFVVEIMNAWFEIRIYYMKSWTHDLKSGFIISYHMQGKITECWLAETEGIFS